MGGGVRQRGGATAATAATATATLCRPCATQLRPPPPPPHTPGVHCRLPVARREHGWLAGQHRGRGGGGAAASRCRHQCGGAALALQLWFHHAWCSCHACVYESCMCMYCMCVGPTPRVAVGWCVCFCVGPCGVLRVCVCVYGAVWVACGTAAGWWPARLFDVNRRVRSLAVWRVCGRVVHGALHRSRVHTHARRAPPPPTHTHTHRWVCASVCRQCRQAVVVCQLLLLLSLVVVVVAVVVVSCGCRPGRALAAAVLNLNKLLPVAVAT